MGLEKPEALQRVMAALNGTVPLYLELLNLVNGAGVKKAIQAVSGAIRTSPDIEGEVSQLLLEDDWRPHLVAALAIILAPKENTLMTKLWERFDAGSWVTPQLVAAAFLGDVRFDDQARPRLESLCQGNAKAFGALVNVAGKLPVLRSLLESLLASSKAKALLAQDAREDRGGEIAIRWLNEMGEQLTACGWSGQA